MRISRTSALWAVVLPLVACSTALAGAPAFEAGDRVAFLGDSIFHGGRVHADLLLFHATRHPAAALAVVNLGIAGDMTREAVRRLDWDVKPARPTKTVVMFGINDVGRWLYGEGKDAPAILDQRRQLLERHAAGLTTILDALAAMDSDVILCTPAPYDQTARTDTLAATGVDDALAEVAENARRVAAERKLGLVDFHREMNAVIRARQADDPSFTMMDAERVHPNEAAHLLMAYVILKAQGAAPTVARVEIDADSGAVRASDNCTVDAVERRDDGVAFDYRAGALPFPVGEKQKPALAWVPFTDDLNREELIVRNLPPGEYELRIDDQAVGAWPAAAWARGVNQATIEATPQYRQAAEVAAMNERRRTREQSTLRVIAALEHDVLRPRGVDTSDMQAVRAAMDAAIAEEAAKQSWRHRYFINLSKAYYEAKPKQAEIERELEQMTQAIFDHATPRVRRMELRRK